MKKIISYLLIILIIALTAGFLFFSANEQTDTVVNEEISLNLDEDENRKFKIIAVGDSLTAGYDLPLSDSYPKILEKKLLEAGADVEVINAGISGETTAGLLERAKFIAEQNPDLLLITTGGNDAFRGLALENTKGNIEKALKFFKASIKAENIFLLQIEATANLGLKYRNDFNDIYKDIADAEKVNLLPFVVREVFLDPSKMLADSIHPNKEGYDLIVTKYIFPAINEKLDR